MPYTLTESSANKNNFSSWTKACLVSKRYNHLLYTGRVGVNRLPRHERLCLKFNLQDVEDVYHFVWICPKYRTIRLKYINRYYCVRPSVYKFYDLLSSNDKKYLYNIACYAKVAFRNNFWLYYYSLKFDRVFDIYIYIFLFFFNAMVSLNHYVDSPNWLITTVFLCFAFITCVICCIMSVLKTMYYVHV